MQIYETRRPSAKTSRPVRGPIHVLASLDEDPATAIMIRSSDFLPAARSTTREWRNWQTRKIQVLVSVRTWRFKSSLPHSRNTPGESWGLFVSGAASRLISIPRSNRTFFSGPATLLVPIIKTKERCYWATKCPWRFLRPRGHTFQRIMELAHATYDLKVFFRWPNLPVTTTSIQVIRQADSPGSLTSPQHKAVLRAQLG